MLTFVLLAHLFGSSLATTIPRLLSDISSGCPANGQISCQSTSPPSNTCCTEYPSGLLLQTQFWDTNVAGSPPTSWTIHGLWNDNCNGTYQEYCDTSRENYNISQLLSEQGATSTLEFMQQYWLNDAGTSEELWDHEWAAHGTCFSTLEPDCLPAGSPQGAEAVAYCETIVRLFQTLPTYTWLANGGITPSTSQTYTLSEILSALTTGSGGYTPDISCANNGLSEISWYFYLQGSVIDGNFIPISVPSFATSNSCPSTGVQYLPKTFTVEKHAPTDEIPLHALHQLVSNTTPGIISITRTAEEISIVRETESDAGDWRCVKIAGPMEFALVGVICALTTPLKDAGIPVFAMSTWNTDYVLVPKGRVVDAVRALSADGWQFVEDSSVHP